MFQLRLDDDLDGAKRPLMGLRKDDDAATLIEYSILIGPLTAAVGDRQEPSGECRLK